MLLKNDANLLPLDVGQTKTIAVIGAFAKTPRYQGAGSSQVNPTRVSTAYEELVKLADQKAAIRIFPLAIRKPTTVKGFSSATATTTSGSRSPCSRSGSA